MCGLRSEQTQKKLLAEPEAIEAANNRNNEMKLLCVAPSMEASMLGVINCACHRCGKRHDVKTCHFKEAKCYKCGKIGHLS